MALGRRTPRVWTGCRLPGALCVLLSAWLARPVSAQVVINEFMASNARTLTNSLLETADWIELYNAAAAPTNLQGWFLTDSAGNLRKWTFPSVTVPGYGYRLVYASGRTPALIGGEVHADFKLDPDGEYLALVRPDGVTVASAYAPTYPDQETDVSFGLRPDTATTPLVTSNTLCRYQVPTSGADGTNWTGLSFNDAGWSSGPAPIGYDETATNFSGLIRSAVPAKTRDVYVRQAFVADNPAALDTLTLRVKYDDGFAAYLNGVLVAHDGAPAGWQWNSSAVAERSNDAAVVFAEFDLTDHRHLLVAGTNVLAMQALNINTHPSILSDLLIAAELSGDVYTPNAGNQWRYFHAPTPGARNVLGAADLVSPVVFSRARGFQDAPFALTLTTPAPGAEIYYSVNSQVPTPATGIRYTGPIAINQTTVVRARAFRQNQEPSAVGTHTYLFAADIIAAPSMRTSITQDPVYGPQMTNALLALPSMAIATLTTAIDRTPELPASVEFILPDGTEGFQIDAGVARFGNYWQNFEKRMFRLYFKKKYGAGKLKYPLFKGFEHGIEPVEEFDQLDLKSGSQDMAARGFYMSEAFTDDTMLEMGNVNPHGRFVHVYLNGQYWGVYHLHERWEVNMLTAYLGGDPAAYEAVDSEGTTENWADEPVHPVDGDGSAWLRIEALRNNYQAVRAYLDVPQYVDFMLMWFAGYSEAEFRGVGPTNANAGGYKMWLKDADGYLRGLGHSMSTPGPGGVYAGLRQEQHPDYLVLERDRIHRLFFHDGVLTPARSVARLINRCNEFEPAFPAESARWGYRTPASYAAEKAAALSRLQTQTAQVLANFRSAGFYPLEAPEIVPAGGVFTGTVSVTLSASNAVYYTMDGSDPRVPGTGAIGGTLYTGPLVVAQATWIKARARSGSTWSALHEALYVPSAPGALRVSELMAHPRNPAGTETNPAGGAAWSEEDFEFVELQNAGNTTLGLAGVRFVEGIDFDFSQSAVRSLAPGAHVLVVRNLDAFRSRYPAWPQLPIAGEFAQVALWPVKTFADNGETVRLVDGAGRDIVRFTYGDGRGWPVAADGAGHSLVPLEVDDQTAALDYGGNWRASAFRDGSPGAADPAPVRDVVLNEIDAHTDYTNAALPEYDSNDWLELFNGTGGGIVLTDWYLSDDADALKKWAIPAGLVIDAGGWRVFDEVTGFHHPITNGFGLDKAGEAVFLSHLPGGAADRVADAVRFKGQENGTSLGRAGDGGAYWYALSPTPNGANAAPVESVVVSEFMYHPAPAGTNPAADFPREFVELYNSQATTAELWTVAGPWRIDGADFKFPAGTTLPPGGRAVVVAFDPASNSTARAEFLAAYGLTNGQVRLFGPWEGGLDNRGERLAIEKPIAADLPEDPAIQVIVDEAIYFDRAPWPAEADGTGRSLQRVSPIVAGRDPGNWFAALTPTPGEAGARVDLAAPANGEVLFAGTPITVRASLAGSAEPGAAPQVAFWQGTNRFGVDADEPFEGVVTLPGEGTFGLRAELTDGAGIATSRTAWVTALAIANLTVEAVTEASAVFRGEIRGAAPADLRVYWGRQDGGTNPAAWEAVTPVGVLSNATFSVIGGPLQPETAYYVRAGGRAGARTGWSPETVSFTTPGFAAWSNRVAIHFPGLGGSQALRDFPVLVRLSTNIAGFAYEQFGGSWASLRFSDEAGTRSLNYDVERWDTNGESAVWVQVPQLTNGTGIMAYWGAEGVTNPSPFHVRGAVWSAGYQAVWHLGGDLADATSNGWSAANQGSTAAAGIVGAARAFDGVGAAVNPGLPASWYGQHLNGLTLSMWVKPAVPPKASGTPFGAAGSGAGLYAAMRTTPQVQRWVFGVGGAEFLGERYDTNAWQMVALVLSNGVAYAQMNAGTLTNVGTYAAFTPTNQPLMGQRGGAAFPFAGMVDEVRLAPLARSGAWLQAAYRTVAEHGAVTRYGRVRQAGEDPDADGDGLPDAWERRHFVDTVGDGAGDTDADGMPDASEFVAGTDPTNALSVMRLGIVPGAVPMQIWLSLLAPQGEGYDGLQRYYDLQVATGGAGLAWEPVPGFTNLAGDDGQLVYTNGAPEIRFFRSRVWLAPGL